MSDVAKKSAKSPRYTIIIEPDVEDGGFVVHIPFLGLATQGETLDEARSMAEDCIMGYLECLVKDGQPIPFESDDCSQKIFVEHMTIEL